MLNKNNNNNIGIYTAPFAKGYKALAVLLLIVTLVIGSILANRQVPRSPLPGEYTVYLVVLHCAQTNSFNATTSYQVPIYTPGLRQT